MLLHMQIKGNTKYQFLVGVFHLKSSAEASAESKRLKQLQYLLNEWKEVKTECGDIPLFIACDLNAVPDVWCKTYVFFFCVFFFSRLFFFCFLFFFWPFVL